MTNTKVSKILVGVDGSKESSDAVNYAMAIAKKEDSEVNLYNCFATTVILRMGCY